MIWEILKVFAICLVLTIFIEAISSFILGYRTIKEQCIIALINMATNPVVVYLSWIFSLIHNIVVQTCLLIIIELIVVIVEAIMLKKFATKKDIPFWIISLLNNGTSFIIGLFINI